MRRTSTVPTRTGNNISYTNPQEMHTHMHMHNAQDRENLEDVGCPMEVRSYVRPRRPSALGATTTTPSTWRAPVAKAVSRSRVPGVWFNEPCFCAGEETHAYTILVVLQQDLRRLVD